MPMITTKASRKIPRVSMRVPGPWNSIDELVKRLPRGWKHEREVLIPADGPPVFIEMMPADDDFPGIFQMSSRRPPSKEELHRIKKYRSNAGVSGPGGSLYAAKHLLQTGAAIIRAGGAGVFVDNGLIAHGASDWLELASACADPMAVFYAYVNIVCVKSHYQSHGMHTLGYRDAVISCRDQPQTSLRSIEDFLRASSCDGVTWKSGESFENSSGELFRVQSLQDECPFEEHPILNPYGRYRLESMVHSNSSER